MTQSATRSGPARAYVPRWFTRLTAIGFPRRFPIVQFPNLPLIGAFLAGQSTRFIGGMAHGYLISVAYLAMTVWAYEELVRGVNWFRRLLGLVFTIVLIMRVAHAVHGSSEPV